MSDEALDSSGMRVLMLATSYPRDESDTASVFLRYLAESLAERGMEVHVIAPADGKGGPMESPVVLHPFRYFPSRFQRLAYGSGILSNLQRNPLLWLQVPFFVAAMFVKLVRTGRALRPDVIHAHWLLPCGLVAALARPLVRAPVLLTAHGGDAFAFRSGIGALLKRLILGRCDHWTANTRATAEALGSEVAVRPTFVPMGVEVRRFAAGRADRHRRALKPDQRVVLFVGRLVEKKGVSDLVSAFARLPTDVAATAQLWIVGDGFLRPRLEKQSRDLGIADQVRFWGVMNNAELPDVYASADVFVAPSVEAESGDTEGQGVVLVEAFAAGVPVVATRVGGIPEVVDDGKTGLLVAPQSVDALQASITRLLTERETREQLTRAARRKVEADYDWRVIAARFTDLYGQLAKPPPLTADAPPAAGSIAKPPR